MNVTIKPGAWAVIICLLLAVSGASGCAKKANVDTVKLEYSFQTADPTTQNTVNEALDSITSNNYSVALEKLKKVSGDPKLTAEQKTAVNGVIAQLEKR